MPLSVTAGKWRAVFKELVQLDRDWKFPPLLPVKGAGCSSAEDGWGVDYTTGDDFFWFSKVRKDCDNEGNEANNHRAQTIAMCGSASAQRK